VRKPSESQHDEDAAAVQKRLRVTALRALTRKEYGAAELQRKLEQKGFPTELVGQVLTKLRDEGLLNDQRYAEAFVRQHVGRGHGPVRIRAELRMSRLPDDAIEAALELATTDWEQLAHAVRCKRFGTTPPRNGAERAKQGRFLQYRGFDSDQIRAAFRATPPSGEAAPEYSDVQDEHCDERDFET
jgi:regulatory protein